MAQERLRISGAHPRFEPLYFTATVGKTPSTLESGTQDMLPPIPHCLSPWLTQEPLPCLPHRTCPPHPPPPAALSHPGSLPSKLLSHTSTAPSGPTTAVPRQKDLRDNWPLVPQMGEVPESWWRRGRGGEKWRGRCQGEGGIGTHLEFLPPGQHTQERAGQ